MSKKIFNLIYLIKDRSSLIITTQNLHQITNKVIYTEYDFKQAPTLTQRYVTQEMLHYPINVPTTQPEYLQSYNNREKEIISKITTNLNKFTFSYNYLLIIEARQFLKLLNQQQVKKHKSDLKLIKEWISFLLEESKLHDYTIEELKEFQEQVIQKQGNIQHMII